MDEPVWQSHGDAIFNLICLILPVSQIVLLAVRAADAVTWSWFVVLIPLWIAVGILGSVICIVVLAAILDSW